MFNENTSSSSRGNINPIFTISILATAPDDWNKKNYESLFEGYGQLSETQGRALRNKVRDCGKSQSYDEIKMTLESFSQVKEKVTYIQSLNKVSCTNGFVVFAKKAQGEYRWHRFFSNEIDSILDSKEKKA